jgi:two-component system cell cycle response regulator CtrA
MSSSEYQRLASPDYTPIVWTHTRILVADDDPDTLELIELAVRGPGIEICTAVDGGELLELIAAYDSFDLIVTDINMPWIEGHQVLASIRAAGLATPVLVVTGLDQPDLPDTIARMGNAMLLRKPFEIVELRQAIARLLGRAL